MKQLIALISVLAISSMLFADPDWDFSGSAGLVFKMIIEQAPTQEGEDKPDAVTDMTWADDGLGCNATATAGDVTGKVTMRKEGDVSACLKVSDAFSITLGKFGRQGYKVGGSKGPKHMKSVGCWGPGGTGQVELLFTADPSKIYVSLGNMKPGADNGIAAINTVQENGGKLQFDALTSGLSYDAFLPEIALTYAFSSDVFSMSAGGALHTFKLIRNDTVVTDEQTQLTSFGAGAKLGITAGIFSMGVAAVYVVNPAIMGGSPGFTGISYKLGEPSGELVNNNFIGFATDIDLKLGEVASTEVGFGYGFNSMDLEGNFKNDAHVAAHLQFNFTALEAIALTPEVGFDLDVSDYNGDAGNMRYYFVFASKISF